VWWHTAIIPALGRLRLEDQEFEDSLSYIAKLCLKMESTVGFLRKHHSLLENSAGT
jgi:hypothetical protein